MAFSDARTELSSLACRADCGIIYHVKSALSVEELASRLLPLVENHDDLLAVLDYAAGALLCLMEAERCGFKEREEPCAPNYQDRVATLIREMQAGGRPQADFWIAGWHFNSALVRIAASYDRAKGVFRQRQRNQGAPRKPDVQHDHTRIDKIRKEVDSLKHVPTGNAEGRAVRFQEALVGLEELIDFITASCA